MAITENDLYELVGMARLAERASLNFASCQTEADRRGWHGAEERLEDKLKELVEKLG